MARLVASIFRCWFLFLRATLLSLHALSGLSWRLSGVSMLIVMRSLRRLKTQIAICARVISKLSLFCAKGSIASQIGRLMSDAEFYCLLITIKVCALAALFVPYFL